MWNLKKIEQAKTKTNKKIEQIGGTREEEVRGEKNREVSCLYGD